jgi:hypothetical protein
MNFKYPAIGVCGLSCRLCPRYHTEGKSRCEGCKTESRMVIGCPFITCAVKRHGFEFCWDCKESKNCEKWEKHRESGKQHDSFKCYQKLEDDISFIQRNGTEKFDKLQEIREKLLTEMLTEFNEGRSKSYYCIAATVLDMRELENALVEARGRSNGLVIAEKSKIMRLILDSIAENRNYYLKLRSE